MYIILCLACLSVCVCVCVCVCVSVCMNVYVSTCVCVMWVCECVMMCGVWWVCVWWCVCDVKVKLYVWVCVTCDMWCVWLQASVAGFRKELGVSESEALNLIGLSVALAKEACQWYTDHHKTEVGIHVRIGIYLLFKCLYHSSRFN